MQTTTINKNNIMEMIELIFFKMKLERIGRNLSTFWRIMKLMLLLCSFCICAGCISRYLPMVSAAVNCRGNFSS